MFILLALIAVSGCTSDTTTVSDEIVIGYNADQSGGSVAPYGVAGRYGFEIAVEEINAAGGILGKQIRAVILDDQADKEISKQNMEQLIFEEGAIAVIGPANSANALYWLDIPQENEVVVISHIATASEITTRYSDRPRNYIFRVSSLDSEQTRLYIAWIIKETNNGKIAIVHDTGAYGTKGADGVNDALASWGKTPVIVESFDAGASAEDLVPILESVKDAKADGIVFFCYADSSAALLEALEQVEDYDPVLVGPAANAVELWDLAGERATKLVFTSSLTPDLNEEAKELNQKIIDRYGEPPPIFSTAANGYDAMQLLAAAIENAGTLEGSAVRDSLEGIENVQGVHRFYVKPFSKENHEGLTAADMHLFHWVDGKLVALDEDISQLEIR